MSARHRRRRRIQPELVPNRPTELGRNQGAQLALLTEYALADIRNTRPFPDDRCKTCAFRAGTLPNGCEETVSDALKAVVERRRFMCHQSFDTNGKPQKECGGYTILVQRIPKNVAPVPWRYGDEALRK